MLALGLDVHQKNTTAAYLDTDTGELTRRKFRTDQLEEELADLDREHTRIVLEVSGTGIFVARKLISCGFSVIVVDAFKAHRIIESQNTAKTDKRDAAALARLLASGQADHIAVWVTDEKTGELRTLTRAREGLVKCSTTLRNQLRALLRTMGCKCPYDDLTGAGARDWIDKFIAALPGLVAFAFQGLWETLLFVAEQIKAFEQQVDAAAEDCEPAQQLMTIHGCGPVLALTIAAEIGDIGRFSNARKLCSYTGLVPQVRQSGEQSHTGPLVRHGNPHLRRAAVLLAQHVAWSNKLKDTSLKRSYYRVFHSRGPNPAKVDLARRLMRVIFAMLRDGTSFEPQTIAA